MAAMRVQKRQRTFWMGFVGTTLTALIVVGLVWQFRTDAQRDPANPVGTSSSPSVSPAVTNPHPPKVNRIPSPAGPSSRVVTRPDDRKSLWESPAFGKPLKFNFLPPGTQWLLYVRPAEILRLPFTPEIIRVLGIDPTVWNPSWQSLYGVAPESVVWGRWTLNMSDTSELQSVVLLCLSEIPNGWKQDGFEAGANFQEGWQRCSDRPDRLVRTTTPLLMLQGPAELIEDIVRSQEPNVLGRELETLGRSTDEAYAISILATPSYLFREGLVNVPKEWHPLLASIEQTLPVDSRGCFCGIHLTQNEVFVEGRVILGQDGQQSAWQKLSEGTRDLPQRVRSLLQSSSITATLEPGMVDMGNKVAALATFIGNQQRLAIRGRQGIIQWSLPASAIPQAILATRLSLLAQDAMRTGDRQPGLQSISSEELLRSQTTIAVAAQPLESMVRELTEVINQKLQPKDSWQIRIDGKSFAEEGITRNQPIQDLKIEAQPLANILTELAMRANPVQAARAPDEANQKVVWIILKPEESQRTEPEGPVVWITTKRGAKAQGWKLPPIFGDE
jgi:hypothetical protein